jgi:hypothetical protein
MNQGGATVKPLQTGEKTRITLDRPNFQGDFAFPDLLCRLRHGVVQQVAH